MIERVIANSMAFRQYVVKNVRMLSYVVADTKKSSLGIILFQLIDYKLGWAWNWSIVEGQVEFILL